MHETVLSSVQFSEVDWKDTTSSITYGPPPAKLFLSIKAVGLLQKPLVQCKENGLLRIVCGSRRLAVCRELGMEPLVCQVLPGSISHEICLRMAVYDNVAQRALNPVEKALALTKMAEYMTQPQLIRELMPLLDLEPSVKILNRYVELLLLETVILNSLASGRLDGRTGFALIHLEPEDRLALFQLFQEVPFSVSVQVEMIQSVLDIALRARISPVQVLGTREIDQFREDQSIPARQRAHEIRRYLQALRAPRLTARKERFAKEIRKLGLPAGVRLVPPAYFEGPKWSLECAFERADELAKRLRRVAHLADQLEFRQLMEAK